MTTYLERYIAGEREAVWDELLALGAAVREEPLYADALAVARETMTRARHNVELLVTRLTESGYQPLPTYKLPEPSTQEEIAKIEDKAGPLPLSVKVWYELVGEVDFSGTHPKWKVRSDGKGAKLLGIFDVLYTRANTEPLQIFAPDVSQLDVFDTHGSMVKNTSENFKIIPLAGTPILWIAHDSNTRTGFCPGGVDGLLLMGDAADGWIAEFEGNYIMETFVQYLRRSFTWGGFPGFANVDESYVPTQWLAELTEGLLPI